MDERNILISAVTKELKEETTDEGVVFRTSFMDPNKNWYSAFSQTREDIVQLRNTILKKGNIIEFELDFGVAKNIRLVKTATQAPVQENKNWADDMVNFEDLLAAAHAKAEKDQVRLNIFAAVTTDENGKVLIDYEKKQALFKATVTLTSLENADIELARFEAHGDAQGISSTMILPHFIRMAETRAVARALRWYTNNAKVADVETGKDIGPDGAYK